MVVCQQAPSSCHIWFISKGSLINERCGSWNDDCKLRINIFGCVWLERSCRMVSNAKTFLFPFLLKAIGWSKSKKKKKKLFHVDAPVCALLFYLEFKITIHISWFPILNIKSTIIFYLLIHMLHYPSMRSWVNLSLLELELWRNDFYTQLCIVLVWLYLCDIKRSYGRMFAPRGFLYSQMTYTDFMKGPCIGFTKEKTHTLLTNNICFLV